MKTVFQIVGAFVLALAALGALGFIDFYMYIGPEGSRATECSTMKTIPLISSQRYLAPAKVVHKARTFKVFVVRTVTVALRGTTYRVLVDGHHNLAAARLAGVEPTWRGPSRKLQRVMQSMGKDGFAQMLINNLTDSDWYDVGTGQVVSELLGVQRRAA